MFCNNSGVLVVDYLGFADDLRKTASPDLRYARGPASTGPCARTCGARVPAIAHNDEKPAQKLV